MPTETGIDQQRRFGEGRSARNLGELAAIEALERYLRGNPDATALLLFEDADVTRRHALLDPRLTPIGTGDFPRELEAAGLLQSADQVLDRAIAQGRNGTRQRGAGQDGTARVRRCNQLAERPR